MDFDIDGARKEGYTDEEIASYLSTQNKFDYAGAVKDGYTPQEVIGFLAPKREESIFEGGTIQPKPAAQQPDTVARRAKTVGAGALASASSMLSGADWVADKFTESHFAEGLAKKTAEWAKDLTPADPTFTDQLGMGIGSMGTFFIPGMGVTKTVGLIGKVAPRLAMWAGVGMSSTLESLAEAGGVYEAQKAKGASNAEAHKAANKTFIANLVLTSATNRLGAFADGGGLVRKTIQSAAMEAPQEGLQSIISELAQGNDIDWNEVATSSAVGAITGGGMGAASHVFLDAKVKDKLTELKDKTNRGEQITPEETAELIRIFTPEPTAVKPAATTEPIAAPEATKPESIPSTNPIKRKPRKVTAPTTTVVTTDTTASASEQAQGSPQAQDSSVAQKTIPVTTQSAPQPTPRPTVIRRKASITPVATPVVEAVTAAIPAEQMIVQPTDAVPVLTIPKEVLMTPKDRRVNLDARTEIDRIHLKAKEQGVEAVTDEEINFLNTYTADRSITQLREGTATTAVLERKARKQAKKEVSNVSGSEVSQGGQSSNTGSESSSGESAASSTREITGRKGLRKRGAVDASANAAQPGDTWTANTGTAATAPQVNAKETSNEAQKEVQNSGDSQGIKVYPKTEAGLKKVIKKLKADIASGKDSEDMQVKLQAHEEKLYELNPELRPEAEVVPAVAQPKPQDIEVQLELLAKEITETTDELYAIDDINSEEYAIIESKLQALETLESELYAKLDVGQDLDIIKSALADEDNGIFSERFERAEVEADTAPEVVQKEAADTDKIVYNADEIRKGQRAYRFANGDIIQGASFADMSNEVIATITQRGGKAEQGYIGVDGVFVSETLLKKQAEPGRKKNVKKILKGLSILKDQRGLVGLDINANNSNAEQLQQIAKLREQFERMEADAKGAKLSPEEYMRKAGFSEVAIAGYLKIKALPIQPEELITKVTKAQKERIAELNISEETKRSLGIDKPLKELTYEDAKKLITATSAETTYETLTNKLKYEPVQAYSKYKSKLSNLKDVISRGFNSPSVVASKEAGSKIIYREIDRADILKHRMLAHILDSQELDLAQAIKAIPEGSESAKKVAMAQEGTLAESALTNSERDALNKLRKFYKWAIDRFVEVKTSNPEEAARVRELAKKVIYNPQEDEVTVLKTLKEFRKEYKLTNGAMEAIELLRMEKQNYLPHVFDRTELKNSAVERLKELKNTKHSDERYRKQIDSLENLISKLDGADFVVYKDIPKSLVFQHLKKRTGAPGYKVDAHVALHTYVRGFLKQLYDVPMLDRIQTPYKTLSPDMKAYMDKYIKDYLGQVERSSVASFVRQFEWIRTLGFNPRSAIVNGIGGTLNTVIEGGRHAITGYRRALTADGKNEFIMTGAPHEIPQVMIDKDVEYHNRMEKLRAYAGWAFNKVEFGLRSAAYHTGKAKGESLGLTGEDLYFYSMDFMHKTQYRYGKVGMPMAMRGWGGVVFQYGSYPVKTLELMHQWLTKEGKTGKLKLLAFVVAAEGGELLSRRLLNMDISGGLGFGVRLMDLVSTLSSASQGEWEEMEKHWKLAWAGGSGILPETVVPLGPAMNLLKVIGSQEEGKVNKIIKELTPVQAIKVKDFYYAMKYSEEGQYPVFKYDSLLNPIEKKYELGLKDTILKAFGPKPSAETELQRREYSVLLNEKEIQKILIKFNRAIVNGASGEVSRLFNQYPGVIGMKKDLGGGVLNEIQKRTLTAEERRQMQISNEDVQRIYMENR